MKVFKVSLAAVVAVGALSSVSAAPLEEAIKDIDVNGFGRYRYENEHRKIKTKDVTLTENDKKSISDSFHRFTLDVNFKATLDDNFFSVIGVRYDTRDISGTGKNSSNKGISNTHGGLSGINGGWGGNGADSLSIRQYYAGYKGIPDTTILTGRQVIGAFFTDDVVGTGLKVLNNSVEGLTLAAVAFDNIENDGDLANNSGIVPDAAGNPTNEAVYANLVLKDVYGNKIEQNNLYGVVAIYSYEWFNAQAWYAHLQNVTNLWAIDLDANYAINDKFSVRGRVNVGGGDFTSQMHSWYNKNVNGGNGSPLANSTIVGVNLGITYDFLSLDAGYITYGKKGKIGALTLEDEGKYIKSGEYVLDYTNFAGRHNVWFGKVGFKYDAYSLGLDYTHDKATKSTVITGSTNVDNVTINAFTIRAGYKYNDKLSFNAWWELKKIRETQEGDEDIKSNFNRFRFDARYNF